MNNREGITKRRTEKKTERERERERERRESWLKILSLSHFDSHHPLSVLPVTLPTSRDLLSEGWHEHAVAHSRRVEQCVCAFSRLPVTSCDPPPPLRSKRGSVQRVKRREDLTSFGLSPHTQGPREREAGGGSRV